MEKLLQDTESKDLVNATSFLNNKTFKPNQIKPRYGMQAPCLKKKRKKRHKLDLLEMERQLLVTIIFVKVSSDTMEWWKIY